MSIPTFEQSPMAYARAAGLLYIIIAIVGAFSIGYMPSIVFAFGDAAATAEKIASNQGLFRLGIFADIVVIICEIVLTAILFVMLKPVNATLSMMAAFSRLAMTVVMGLNLINYLVPLLLLSAPTYLGSFAPEQLSSLALLFLDAHEFGVYVWQVFFSLHLLVLGYLVFKSTFLPKVLGLLMMVGSFGYLVQALEKLTLTQSDVISMLVIGLLVIVTIGELAFALWLLIKGLNVERLNKTLAARSAA
jgi:uncharacterized protein DUF4386